MHSSTTSQQNRPNTQTDPKCKFVLVRTALNKLFKKVSPKEFFAYIDAMAEQKGYCWARNRAIARDLETSEAVIKYLIRLLLIMGVIRKEECWDVNGYKKRKIFPLVHVDEVTDEIFFFDNNLYEEYIDLDNKIDDKKILPEGKQTKSGGLKIKPKSLEIKPKSQKIIPHTENRGKQKIKKYRTETEKHVRASQITFANQATDISSEFSGSDSVFCVSGYQSVSIALQSFGMHESQAIENIEKHGVAAVRQLIDDVAQKGNVRNMGAYLAGVLKKDTINFLSNKKGTETHANTDRDQAKIVDSKLAQVHWNNINKWWSKHYLIFESYINNQSVDQKHVIFELSEILQGNVRAYKYNTLNEPLNGKVITIGELRDRCDQLMEEEKTSQETIKTIVSEPVEKASKATQKPKHIQRSLVDIIAGSKADLSGSTLAQYAKKLEANKAKTPTEKAANADKQRQIAEAILAEKSLAKGGLQLKSEAVSESVPDQVNQGFIKNSESVKINYEAVNESVKPQSWCGEDLNSGVSDEISTNPIDRQQKIIDHLKFNGQASMKEFEKLFPGVSRTAIKNTIKPLLETNKIWLSGKGRFAFYKLT